MAMDKRTRITLLLVIDTAFALIELISGYAVHSLALVADSFHMFNDILSLIVALWAVKASQSGSSPTYSYGLQRAEVLGALVNAVFLLALCVTIFLEAIQRFIEKPNITNPKLILVVGIFGLLSNILGLFLFHDHDHAHGGGHGHSHGDAEAGHVHSHGGEHGHAHSHDAHGSRSDARSGLSSLMPESAIAREEQRLLSQNSGYGSTSSTQASGSTDSHHRHDSGDHGDHNHTRAKKSTDHGSGRSMNMEGVFLHVLGDALGNIGVILTAIFIWKTDFSWRFYFDPAVSLFITAIIFSTAVPLCIRASKVLLQATPSCVNCDEVAEDIQSLPGVQEIHDLHIWQLSENQLVATLHVTVDGPAAAFSKLSRTIQECFAGYGVPSLTIQPEFTDDSSNAGPQDSAGLRQCQSNGNLLSSANN